MSGAGIILKPSSMEPVKPEELKEIVAGPLAKDAAMESLLEQYRLFVEMMDRNAERRQNSNSFFFSLSAGLFAAVAFLHSKDTDDSLRPLTWVVSLSGIPISIFWQRLIGSYRNLGTAKFEVIHQMEKHLPFAPYSAEWKFLEEGRNSAKYLPLTHLEVWIPRCFIVAFLALTLWAFPWSAFAHSSEEASHKGVTSTEQSGQKP